MADFIVKCIFNAGSGDYKLPHIFQISDPNPGMKATVIGGTRSSGSIVIPGGQKSIEITVRGRLIDNDGYADITTLIGTMKSSVTTNVATLTLKHWTGATWQNDWSYTVRRIEEIEFPESLRTWEQEYFIRFLVLVY